MQWFKHDSDANMDAKLQEVLLDYGLEGYGLYWYCIELITSKLDKNNLTFELEHDSRIIARNTGSTQQKVQEMMRKFIDLGLFDENEGNIRCLKLLKRLDSSMTNSKQMREFITTAKQRHDHVMTSTDNVMLEENRKEKNIKESKPDYTHILVDQVIDMYNTVKSTEQPNWTSVESRTKSRVSTTKKRIADVQHRIESKDPRVTMDWFTKFLIALSADQFYSGRPRFPGDSGYKWNFDSLFREKNFVAAIEALNDE